MQRRAEDRRRTSARCWRASFYFYGGAPDFFLAAGGRSSVILMRCRTLLFIAGRTKFIAARCTAGISTLWCIINYLNQRFRRWCWRAILGAGVAGDFAGTTCGRCTTDEADLSSPACYFRHSRDILRKALRVLYKPLSTFRLLPLVFFIEKWGTTVCCAFGGVPD